MDWNSLFITLKLACITTTILLVVSIPLAYKLAYSKYRFKAIFESLISLPLVLPPLSVQSPVANPSISQYNGCRINHGHPGKK